MAHFRQTRVGGTSSPSPLLRGRANEKGPPRRYNIPAGLAIEDGKTEYKIELGKGYKP